MAWTSGTSGTSGLAVVARLLVFLALLAPSSAALAQKKIAKPTVAILYFDYDGSSEEMGFLRKGLTQMLVSDLSDVTEVDIVERVRLQDALEELELNRTNKIDQSSANRIGKLLGARYLVMGGYFDIAGTLRMDARVVEVETGKVVASLGKHGKAGDFIDLERYLATELARVLRGPIATGTPNATPVQVGGTGSGNPDKPAGDPGARTKPRRRKPRRPKSLDARQAAAYGRALDAVDRGDQRAAETILQDLVAKKPDFQIAALDLASLRK
jgi:TolB-like protein